MARRLTARELEAAAAARSAGASAARGEARRAANASSRPGAAREGAARSEPLLMLLRRGLDPRPSPPDVPFDPEPGPALAGELRSHLSHYAFRLFLRGAILRPEGFAPAQATRYLPAARSRELAEACVELGIAERLPRGRFRLVRRARSFGGTLEWWLARELEQRLGFEVAHGVRSGAQGVGGDLDVVAAGEGKLVYVEAKSSPPKHVTRSEVSAFLRRVRAVRPDVALFVVDTALRLSDKILPMFDEALAGSPEPPAPPRRIFRETWAITPHLFAVNAREDLVENVCRAIAEGLRALAPRAP
jgi:hypothetical protein